jgi:putative sterol carrier protein
VVRGATRTAKTATTTGAFFEALAARGREPLLKSASGTLRFDLLDGEHVEHWYVTVTHGDVDVSHKHTRADCVVRISRRTFEGLVTGRVNATAAALRGELVPEGDLGLLLLFQRMFPSPSRRARSRG